MGNFLLQAKTFYGFEHILAKEIAELGGADVQIKNRLVEFYGDLGFMYKANYSLRTALRIIKPIYNFTFHNEEDLYRKVKKFHWENILSENDTFLIDSTVNSTKINHSQFAALKVKDAIVDRFREKNGKRPSISKWQPKFLINLYIAENKATISLDSSGDPLFKRGYREKAGKAPLNEVMAAGLLHLANWDGKGNFLDPMCGSGTLPIEAAMMAANIPAQINRNHFGFMNWRDYDDQLFQKIKMTRLDKINDFHGKIVGYDVESHAIAAASKNVISADLEDFIKIEKQDFFDSEKNLFPVLLVFNPPYDERMKINSDDFYEKIGNTLKHNYPNTIAWFITSDMEAVKKVGLKPSKKIKLYNGKLECYFLQYEMYEGSKKVKNNQ